MAQKTTFSVARETEADRIAARERAKEDARIARTEEMETLQAIADEEIKRTAAEIVRERMEKRNGASIDTAALAEQAEERLAQREADEARLEALVKEHDKGIKTFYVGMRMAFGSAMKDQDRSLEAGRIAGRLGRGNPIRTTVMQLGDGMGVVQDNVRFVDEVCAKFAELYRKNSGQIDRDYMERGL